MANKKRYWLLKSEPRSYSIDDLERDITTLWDGVRNYQARNFMRDDMHAGDEFLFYHSSSDPMGVVGVGKIVGASVSDENALDSKSHYYDLKAKKDNNPWVAARIEFGKKFKRCVTLEEIKQNKKLEGIMVAQRGSRLSVQPVSEEHFKEILRMAE